MVRGMSAHGVRPYPVYFSERDKLPGASCYLRIMFTTILIIIILLLCVLVWFMAYLWVIYS